MIPFYVVPMPPLLPPHATKRERRAFEIQRSHYERDLAAHRRQVDREMIVICGLALAYIIAAVVMGVALFTL